MISIEERIFRGGYFCFNLPDFSGKTPFDLSVPQDLVELELRQIHEKQSRDDLQRRESIQRDPEV